MKVKKNDEGRYVAESKEDSNMTDKEKSFIEKSIRVC